MSSDRRKAPWPDYRGAEIFEGDTIIHPSGERGVVEFDAYRDAGLEWRAKYSNGESLWLGNQIGNKGQACVELAERSALVKQRSNFDCALAVLAMVSGRPYGELFDAEFCARIEKAGTCSGDNLDEAYRRAGFVNGENMWVFGPGLLRDYQLIRNLIRGRRAMIQVPSLNYEGSEHFIYWDGKLIHDPSNKQVYLFMQNVFPSYITIFDESAVNQSEVRNA